MVKIGSKNNLIKNMMAVLGNKIAEARIGEAMKLLNEICKCEFTPDVPVFFYYDKYIVQ